MWALVYKDTEKLHLISRGRFNPAIHNMRILEYHEIPEQDVSHLYQGDPPQLIGTLNDLKQYTPEEKAALIDRDTGRAIDETIHPFAGVEEQVGRNRAQIAAILNAIGLEPLPEFDEFNTIATEKIAEGRAKKEELNAEDN